MPHFIPTILLASAVFCACAMNRAAVAPAPSVQKARPNPAQEAVEEAAIAAAVSTIKKGRGDYKINPADLLDITVYRTDDLARTLRVSQKGTVSFPLIGVLEVAGKSVIEAEKDLRVRLAEYLVDPQVTIFVKEYGNKKIYVLGEVKEPGSFDLPTESRLTVLEAISKAGGFSQIAARDRTKVIRTDADGKNISFTVEVSAITTRGEKDKDLPLEPNDVIYIPQSFF